MQNTEKLYLEKLVALCNKIYFPAVHPLPVLNISHSLKDGIINFASKNRLIHFFAYEYRTLFPELQRFVVEYEAYQSNIRDHLDAVNKILGSTEFLVIKTFSGYPHITSDLDILVKEEKIAMQLQNEVSSLHKKNNLPLDCSAAISWNGVDPIDKDFIWQNIQPFQFQGISCFVPNAKLDTLIRIAHMPFELAQVRLGELLHIFSQSRNMRWEVLNAEARKMKWPRTFVSVKEMLSMLHNSLFGVEFFDSGKSRKKETNIVFPYHLPIRMLLGSVIEKRAWRKIFGARFIMKDRMFA